MQVDWESHSEDKFKEGQRCLEATCDLFVQLCNLFVLFVSLPLSQLE